MFTKNKYYYYKKAFNDDFCNHIIHTANLIKADEAKVGNNEKLLKVRNSNICWIDNKEIIIPILQLMEETNKRAEWNFNLDLNIDLKAQFTVYSKGQHYDWHVDSSPATGTEKNRKMSFTLNLSDPKTYKGGEFEFDYRDIPRGKRIERITQATEKGSCILFPSYICHRVKPVTKGVRYSLVVWLEGNNWV